ncbi:DUF3558 domain-containing protein [Nocardia cyriacigeorgica]|nr:DUF3558 domain-containing protein [Nocardia cyriacigeorgica]
MLGALLAVAALTVAGCSSGTTDGEPVAQQETSGEKTVQFNPCEDLSADALTAAGLDPASEHTTIDPPTGATSWRICAWKVPGQPYSVSIGASTHMQDEVLDNPTVTDFADVQIGSRSGMTYRQVDDEHKLSCYVSLPSSQGMFNVIADWPYSKRDSVPEAPPCSLAIKHATDLEPYLPE